MSFRALKKNMKNVIRREKTDVRSSLPKRWNRSGFLTTGTGLSGSDRTGPAGLPVTSRLPVTNRSTGNRRVTGTGSISDLPLLAFILDKALSSLTH